MEKQTYLVAVTFFLHEIQIIMPVSNFRIAKGLKTKASCCHALLKALKSFHETCRRNWPYQLKQPKPNNQVYLTCAS